MKTIILIVTALALLGLSFVGCQKSLEPAPYETPASGNFEQEMSTLQSSACPVPPCQAPSPTVTVNLGDNNLQFWPYTGNDFSGTAQDPINLIFFGKADPRDIRTALMALPGDRTSFGYPPMPPFNSTWDDAIGDVQTGYGEPDGWSGGCIQLACGEYGPIRFHIRLFKMGKWTVANAHFEVNIPGTSDHQVLSWEAAEQLVIVDFMRSGLLDPEMPMVPTALINDSPWRTIPSIIYNGLPAEVRGFIGGPIGDVTEDVPIGTDGHAMILNLAAKAAAVPGVRVQDFVINYNIVAPKPFCSSGPYDYVYITGPVHLVQTTEIQETGTYKMSFRATGNLVVVPVNPMNGEAIGAPMTAQIAEEHGAMFMDQYWSASSSKYQKLGSLGEPGGGQLFARLLIRSNGLNGFQQSIRCAGEQWRQAETATEVSGLTSVSANR
ncbi:exported hypothetical protein [Candidatus Zixiibacteriota bacterium]|nr:exported hypothetical protein [candidate division Zixibacteria bacterium]